MVTCTKMHECASAIPKLQTDAYHVVLKGARHRLSPLHVLCRPLSGAFSWVRGSWACLGFERVRRSRHAMEPAGSSHEQGENAEGAGGDPADLSPDPECGTGAGGWPAKNSKGKPFTRHDALRMLGFNKKQLDRVDTFTRLTRLTGVFENDPSLGKVGEADRKSVAAEVSSTLMIYCLQFCESPFSLTARCASWKRSCSTGIWWTISRLRERGVRSC